LEAVYVFYDYMIKVNQKQCIGCGLCVSMCPETFKMNDLGKSEVIDPKPTSCAKKAASNCPVGAISL